MTKTFYAACPSCLDEMQRAMREIERLRAALEIVTKDRDSLLTTFGSTPAQMADKLAKMRAPDEPSAQHFDPASVPDCPRCGVAHWPQCPEKS